MYIQRKIHHEIKNHLGRKEYSIITGARQSGKTSLIQALYNELKNNGKVVNYISFEDRDILSAINKHPEEIFSFTPRPEKPLSGSNQKIQPFILFIDEVQYATDPSNFLKYLYDIYRENLKIIATGSSAFYIDTKFTDSLSGRKRLFELQTLDFEEWLIFKNLKDLLAELKLIRAQNDYISTSHKELLEKFNEFLIFGGYPEVVLENNIEEKINLLKDIKNSFLKRDIDESGISNPDKFYNLLTLLAGQTGNLVNRNELANTIEVDNKTIDKYLYVLQKCFHIELVKPFYSNLRKELTKMPKIYFKDLGLRNVALIRFFNFKLREDQGALLENYVYKRLTGIYDSDSIRFWRTTDNKEIDFIINTSYQQGLAYEVKMNCKTAKQTILKKFGEFYSNYPAEIVSYDIDSNCKWVLKL
ncbi:MAG: ATP-binding protein [Bacteroidales bacterium]|nr:ATP-binding protein [Bacteroidales bacterium]